MAVVRVRRPQKIGWCSVLGVIARKSGKGNGRRKQQESVIRGRAGADETGDPDDVRAKSGAYTENTAT